MESTSALVGILEQAYNFSTLEVSQKDRRCEGNRTTGKYPINKKDNRERKEEKNDFKDRAMLERPKLSQI